MVSELVVVICWHYLEIVRKHSTVCSTSLWDVLCVMFGKNRTFCSNTSANHLLLPLVIETGLTRGQVWVSCTNVSTHGYRSNIVSKHLSILIVTSGYIC